jgi:hypothetical protein
MKPLFGRRDALVATSCVRHSGLREDLLAAPKILMRLAMTASAWGILPYVAFNTGLIAFHEGSIIHMSKLEWAILTAVLSLVLWLGSAMILAVSAFTTGNNAWLFVPLALAVFTGFALMLVPYSWTDLFDPFELVLGTWVFWVGVLSTILFLLLGKWNASPEVH